MWCRIYTEAGQLVTEGVRGVRRDGTLELMALRAQRPLQPGEGPLLVVEGPRRYPVRVTARQMPRATAQTGATTETIYHLSPLVTA